MREKADRNLKLATILNAHPSPNGERPRSADEILMSALRRYDDAARRWPDEVGRLELDKVLVQLAKMAVDSGADKSVNDRHQRAVDLEGATIAAVLHEILDPLLICLCGTDGEYRRALKDWALNAAHTVLTLDDPVNDTAHLPPMPKPTEERLALPAGSASARPPRPPAPTSNPDDPNVSARNAVHDALAEEDSDEVIVDAEIVDEPEDPKPAPRRGWSPPQRQSPWRTDAPPWSARLTPKDYLG